MPGEAVFVVFVAVFCLMRRCASYQAYKTRAQNRRPDKAFRRIRHSVPDATLTRLIRPTGPSTEP